MAGIDDQSGVAFDLLIIQAVMGSGNEDGIIFGNMVSRYAFTSVILRIFPGLMHL